MESGQPPAPPVQPPSLPPTATWGVGSVDLRVGRRLLWVGNAAYPMQNITRVYTVTIMPRRQEAVVRFLTRAAITAAVAIALTLLASLPAVLASAIGAGDGGFGLILFVWLVGFGAGIYCLVDMISVLSASPRYVLAIETSGLSTALVTSSNPSQLPQLVGYIVHAIENPQTEFQVKVETLAINPSNYYFGDNVNMYGGTGNVGMAA
ncbi:DUF6232 family protein [Streptomyces sp. NPDC056192]|uniref:DUF6232 family protein n=1 Tax=Streptomyces sp. NPDC056192 TaxID=3345743 RepID=UPI0035D956DA